MSLWSIVQDAFWAGVSSHARAGKINVGVEVTGAVFTKMLFAIRDGAKKRAISWPPMP